MMDDRENHLQNSSALVDSEDTSIYDLMQNSKSPLTTHDLSYNMYSAGKKSVGFKRSSQHQTLEQESVPHAPQSKIQEKHAKLNFNGYIGDFKQFRDLLARSESSSSPDRESTPTVESEDEVISIEETYREVGLYKTPSEHPQQMTVIQEEELEDSQLHSQ